MKKKTNDDREERQSKEIDTRKIKINYGQFENIFTSMKLQVRTDSNLVQ